ncbi:hypothetical protein N9R04_03465 [Staphylococcus sp. SQ8-PEA]|uniref:Uncharacterized protein n=1 Tax=Staphylococcus marylandisciuri TaxID=2981529 RepID=A0ABT2QP66_9STAP|nr:hypothetical protein [Staphylococcus marylandisciuri]MCU5745780.1 hypothetical protein [Staphylococcus marylandisciuri]
MDKRNLIRTIVTVAPVFLVPLITERKRIKEHPDIKRAANATGRASRKVANKSIDFKDAVVDKSGDAKDYVVEKKHHYDQKRRMKKIAKENDPKYIEKQEQKQEKKNQKEADKQAKHEQKVAKKQDKKLQKKIQKRQKQEEKVQKQNAKKHEKQLKKADKKLKKAGFTPSELSEAAENKSDQLKRQHVEAELAKKDRRVASSTSSESN